MVVSKLGIQGCHFLICFSKISSFAKALPNGMWLVTLLYPTKFLKKYVSCTVIGCNIETDHKPFGKGFVKFVVFCEHTLLPLYTENDIIIMDLFQIQLIISSIVIFVKDTCLTLPPVQDRGPLCICLHFEQNSATSSVIGWINSWKTLSKL